MKKLIFLILISLCLASSLHAETEKELFENGVLFFKQGNYQQAIDKFSNLIEIAPDHADAYKNRGVSYMKQEKFDLAIKDFEKAKELFPELKGLYSNLGVAWYYKKDYEKAIENYDIEIQMAPENHVAYFNRALCLAELGRNREALDNLSQTLKLRPDFYWAICYKADLLAQSGENLAAIDAYEAAIQADPKNSYATDKLARLKQKIKAGPPLEPAAPGDAATNKSAGQEEVSTDKNPGQAYALQAGAFLNQANAGKMNVRLKNNGFDSRVLVLKDSKDRTWHLVRSGRYATRKEAKKAAASLKEKLKISALIRPADDW